MASAQPARDDCEAEGGTYTFSRGDATCTVEDNPGEPQSDNASEPFSETDVQPGQGGGGGEDSEDNPNFEDGPRVNRGGNTPGGGD